MSGGSGDPTAGSEWFAVKTPKSGEGESPNQRRAARNEEIQPEDDSDAIERVGGWLRALVIIAATLVWTASCAVALINHERVDANIHYAFFIVIGAVLGVDVWKRNK